MAQYRAVMGTTIDCEGCKFNGDECLSDVGCIAINPVRKKEEVHTEEGIKELIRQTHPELLKR